MEEYIESDQDGEVTEASKDILLKENCTNGEMDAGSKLEQISHFPRLFRELSKRYENQ